MKIVYFSLDYTPHDQRFLASLAGTAHEVYFVRLQRAARQTEDRPLPAGIRLVQWGGGMQPFRWRDLSARVLAFRRVCRELQPDVIHAGPIQTCGLIATLAGVHPRLIMSWGFDLMQDDTRNAWWRWATRFVLRRAQTFTSDCEATRNKAIAYGMPPERTRVFPWGVDLQTFTPAAPRAGQGFTLFCNRSWEPRYGVDVLARAFVEVARTHPQLGLLLLGAGSQAHALRQIFQQGGVLGRVTFAGQVPNRDLPRYYALADLYISPSHVDGSSVSLMEAMACGLPCLVSDIPANCEWITDGQNGWLFPDGDAARLAERIRAALAERAALAPLGAAARRTAEAKADWHKNFAALLALYQVTAALKAGGK